MSKLSDTTKQARKFVVYFLIFALVVILLQNLIRIITKEEVFEDISNSPYAFVNNDFGEIIYPEIESLTIVDGSKPVFSVDGTFEKSPTSVNVYTLARPRETLGSVEKGQSFAKYLNFTPEAYKMSDSKLIWEDTSRKYEFDKITRDTAFSNTTLVSTSIPNLNKYRNIDDAQQVMQTIYGQLTQYRSLNIVKNTTYEVQVGNNLTSTFNSQEADFINNEYFLNLEIVSLKSLTNDQSLDDTARPLQGKIYQNNPEKGISSIKLLNRQSSSNSVELLKYFDERGININSQKGVYRLLSKEEAWEDIKEGKGSLKKLLKQGNDPLGSYQPLEVSRFIANPNEVELGFFLPDGISQYIYPIYLFKGRAELATGETAEFTFYVKAIKE